jgi:hypothetical protein
MLPLALLEVACSGCPGKIYVHLYASTYASMHTNISMYLGEGGDREIEKEKTNRQTDRKRQRVTGCAV